MESQAADCSLAIILESSSHTQSIIVKGTSKDNSLQVIFPRRVIQVKLNLACVLLAKTSDLLEKLFHSPDRLTITLPLI